MKTLKQIMDEQPKLSLRRICEETGACYQYCLKASKKPIANRVYDPSAFNYSEVETLLRKKVDIDTIDWEAVAATIKVAEPVNQPEEFQAGVQFTFRNDEEMYEVIFTTETHIVFMSVNETQPRVMNYSTFIHQSPRVRK